METEPILMIDTSAALAQFAAIDAELDALILAAQRRHALCIDERGVTVQSGSVRLETTETGYYVEIGA